MDFASLPRYRAFPKPSTAVDERGPVLSPRARRIARDLALSLAMVVALYLLRQFAAALDRPPPPVPPPLEFRVVAERFRRLEECRTRAEVERLLGPPTDPNAWGPELAQFEERWWNSGRNWFPKERLWHRWSDPGDPDRWVAVVYTGYAEPIVYARIKKGF